MLSTPATASVYALKIPRWFVRTANEARGLRQNIDLLSLMVHLATIPIIYLNPSLLTTTEIVHSAFDPDVVGAFFASIWIAVFPLFVAFPLYL